MKIKSREGFTDGTNKREGRARIYAVAAVVFAITFAHAGSPALCAAKKATAKKAAPVVAGKAAKSAMPSGYVQMKGFTDAYPMSIGGWKAHEGDVAGADGVKVDDSAWKDAGPGYSWHGDNTVVWFRKKLTLPATAAGKSVYLDVMVNDSSEVYVDGAKVAEFGSQGRMLLAKNAEPKKVYNIAIKAKNGDGIGVFMFAGYQAMPGSASADIRSTLDRFAGLGGLDSAPFYTGWKFAQKSPKNAEAIDFNDSDWAAAPLSHSWTSSKPTGWYRATYITPERVNGFAIEGKELRLSAGGSGDFQVYVNGKRAGKFTGGGDAQLTAAAKPGEPISIAIKLAELTGRGRFDRAAVIVPSLGPVRAAIDSLSAKLGDVATLFEQHPKPEKKWTAATGAALARVEKLLTLKEKTAGALTAELAAISKDISALDGLFNEFPLFLKGPYLQNVTQDAITVMWQTPIAAKGCVLYGLKTYDKSVCEDKPATIHEIRLTGLKAQTEYRYAALTGKLASPGFTFKTAVKEATPFIFSVWGDNRTDFRTHQSVVSAMLSRPSRPDIALSVGDVVTHGSHYDQWGREYFLPFRPLGAIIPSYIAIGNHEYGGFGYGNRVTYFEDFVSHPAPNDYYYAFTYGNSRFVILNPQAEALCCNVRPGTPQYEWMIKEFESPEYKKAKFRFLLLHEPPYSDAWSGGYYDGEPLLRADLVPLIEKYKVDIVFAGHTHDYERGQWPKGDGPYYIITGGGGSSLDDTIYKKWPQIDIVKFVYNFCEVSVTGNTLNFKAIDRDGKEFDSFKIVK